MTTSHIFYISILYNLRNNNITSNETALSLYANTEYTISGYVAYKADLKYYFKNINEYTFINYSNNGVTYDTTI